MKYLSQALLLIWCLHACTKPMTERDPIAADSVHRENLFYADIDISFSDFGYGHFGAVVKAELSDGQRAINADSTTMLLNGTPMEYSVGVGNYYDRYPAFKIEFDETSMWADTLTFAVVLRDSTQHSVGFFMARPFLDFVATKALYLQVTPDKTKPLTIDWGGVADHVTIERTITKTTKSGITIISEKLTDQDWANSKPIILTPAVFNVDSGKVNNIYISWIKESQGVINNDNIGGTIHARAEVTQKVQVENSED